MGVMLKKKLLKISHGFMAETTVSALNQPFPLIIKTVDVRAVNTTRFPEFPIMGNESRFIMKRL